MGIGSITSDLAFSLELGLVADPVIEAIAKLEFEDGLRNRLNLRKTQKIPRLPLVRNDPFFTISHGGDKRNLKPP